ncbi:MAG: hypothetical protein SH808_09835 [Saprospiraceae bacterium]|nr:hypothetical protein [Saprospiraceae bacterium]
MKKLYFLITISCIRIRDDNVQKAENQYVRLLSIPGISANASFYSTEVPFRF